MSASLEKGLFRLCAELIAEDEEFRKNAEHRNFDAVDTPLFREYRLYRLKQTLRYAEQHSRFYRKSFEANGSRTEDVRSTEDLVKLPFTYPDDIVSGGYDFLCISQGGVEKPVTYNSTGTTGPKKRFFFSKKDVASILSFLGVGMNTVTDTDGTIQVLLPDSNGRGIGSMLAAGCRQLGMNAYSTGMEADSADQIKATREHHPDVWFGDTNTIYRITKEMEHKINLRDMGVKVLFCTIGQPSTQMATNLERIWGCRVSTHYGLTEVGWGLAVDCEKGTGYHYNELNVIIEVVDPVTGEVLPDGCEGELVFTTVGREAMPLIRYRSRDIGSLTSKMCDCSCGLQSLSHVARRLESTVEFPDGYKIYPTLFDDKVYCFDEVVDYDIYIDRKSDRPVLLLDVEAMQLTKGLASAISRSVMEVEGLKDVIPAPKIKLEPQGTLKKWLYRKKMIRDAKEWL